MRQQTIAEAAQVPQCYVSRYKQGVKIPESAKQKIEEQINRTKADRALEYLKTGATLTPAQFYSYFGIHSASQQCSKWRARGINVVNIVPEDRKYQTFAIYKYMGEEK